MTAGRLIVRGAAASAAGLVVRLGARLVFLIVAGQLYGAALFGAYSLAVAGIELAVAIGGLGMKRLVFQLLDERGERPEIHVVADAAALVALASAFLGGVLLLGVTLAADIGISENTAEALSLLAPMIAAQALLDLLLAATRWKHVIRYEVAARSLVEPYAALAGAAGAWFLGFDETGLLIGYGLGTLAALLFAVEGVRRSFRLAELRSWRMRRSRSLAMLRGATANTAADGLSGLLVRLDLYLVGILLGEHSAGIYGMARQLALPIRQVRQSFDGLLTPLVARTVQAGGPQAAAQAVASAARLVLALQLPMVIAMIAVGYPLLRWLGPEFAAGWIAAILLAAAETVQGAFGISELLFVYRRPRLGLGIMAATIALALMSVLALTSVWGLAGAAAAVLLSNIARAGARRIALKRSLGVGVPVRHSLGPALAGIAGAAAASLLLLAAVPGGWAAALGGGLAVYFASLFFWLRLTGERLALDHFSDARRVVPGVGLEPTTY
jgi:O-antigen/teichoic acid export membrane protein